MVNENPLPLHGGQLRSVSQRFGIPASELLDFSANINPSGPPACVLSTLRVSLHDPATLAEYPDLEQTDLRLALAASVGTEPECVAAANGFVPLLEAAVRALKLRSCLLPVPAFVEYRRALERAGVAIVPYELRSESCFAYDPATMFRGQQDAVLLANPQNPSGVVHDRALICKLVAAALKKGTLILLDEAFIDYIPEHSLGSMTEQFRNLIVFRSVTKFYGMPGLRVAYAIANPTLCAAINEHLAPWPITTLASRAVIAALEDQAYAARARAENEAQRSKLRAQLEPLGLVVYPSAGNFLLFRVPPAIDPNQLWQHLIVRHHIVIRSCENYDAMPAGHFRVAIRTASDNNRLVLAVQEAIGARSV